MSDTLLKCTCRSFRVCYQQLQHIVSDKVLVWHSSQVVFFDQKPHILIDRLYAPEIPYIHVGSNQTSEERTVTVVGAPSHEESMVTQ